MCFSYRASWLTRRHCPRREENKTNRVFSGANVPAVTRKIRRTCRLPGVKAANSSYSENSIDVQPICGRMAYPAAPLHRCTCAIEINHSHVQVLCNAQTFEKAPV